MRRSNILIALTVAAALTAAVVSSVRSASARTASATAVAARTVAVQTAESIASARTSAAISESDLRARLFIFADDSMQGRRAGTIGHDRATAYIARELTRLGLTPAGDKGSWFQRVQVGNAKRPDGWSRNVVAILPGSDPVLRAQYVALGAHSDHLGMETSPRGGRSTATPDTIYNGADDDGSGSMALLEVAEYLASAPEKLKRSVLFVWHTGEEIDLNGSREFTEHPPVPLSSIVVQLNIDMIGRGSAADLPTGGPNYLSVIGARRRSNDLARWVREVSAAQELPLALDYSLDADDHPEQIYCRSDHWMYARRGIPIVFLFTNLHRDYHAVTDEAQFIDYPHFTRITRYVLDLTRKIANNVTPPRPSHPVPTFGSPCKQ